MASWHEFERDDPALAERVAARFTAQRHHTLATLRADGAPRISGTEVEFRDGELLLGMMGGSRKARDLQRDPRLALHSASVDPDDDDPAGWVGDAKVAGRAVERTSGATGAHEFRIDIDEVVFTEVAAGGEHLAITLWKPGDGTRVFERR